MEFCYVCKCKMEKDDVALCKKLLGRKTRQFFCRTHLADFLETDVESLTLKVEQFKEEGCTLFL